jgi:hypothetical protein
VTVKKHSSQAPVAHTYNPSYSGGRDRKDHGSKPALGKQFARPYLKNIHHKKKTGAVAQGGSLSSNPSTAK